ncbi:MAG: hypothetical protein J5I50_08575 [Chitinophagaceae bacterium]|nr:hypothetical protein [Chitinophagaceae bacterium]
MKKCLFLLTGLFFYLSSSAQVPKAVYAELLGPGVFSVNYDMRFSNREDGFGGRIGVGGLWAKDEVSKVGLLTIPAGLNYLFGNDGKNYFEVGLGVTYVKVDASADEDSKMFNGTFGNATLGYRLAPEAGGFFFKIQLTPIFNKNGFFPFYGGVGLGYKF